MRLREPVFINSLRLRNRIVMPPMATGKADGGKPDEKLIAYYAARARATGLIIVEHEYVAREGMANATQLSMADDAAVPAYRLLTGAIHKEGAAVFAQINHAGALARDTGLPAKSPSGVSIWDKVAETSAMTAEDIDFVKDAFKKAALRAKDAGFDGVEIHSAHGYLLNQFYSPLTNCRTDLYGGDLRGRTRLHAGILREIRAAVGEDYPVAIRFGAYDYREGGSRKEEIPEACRIFREAGADLIDISGGFAGFLNRENTGPGWFSELSRAAKESVDVPVLLTGGVTTGKEAEDLLESGAADLIGVGRAMLKNPDWAVEALR